MRRDVVRFLGHPLHAALVHAPLGLLLVVPAWDALACAGVEGPWGPVGWWSVVAGLVAAAPAAVVGLTDLLRALPDPTPAQRTALWHLFVVAAALAAFAVGLVARGGPDGGGLLVLALDVLGLALLSWGGWLGGHLVFHHGVGRREARSLPEGDLDRDPPQEERVP